MVYGSGPYLEAREQKRKRGKWSMGRKIADARIHACSDSRLPWTEPDKALAACLRKRTYRSRYGYPEVEMHWDRVPTWHALVGHPAIFDADGAPVRVVRRTPSLRVESRDGGRLITLSPRNGAASAPPMPAPAGCASGPIPGAHDHQVSGLSTSPSSMPAPTASLLQLHLEGGRSEWCGGSQ